MRELRLHRQSSLPSQVLVTSLNMGNAPLDLFLRVITVSLETVAVRKAWRAYAESVGNKSVRNLPPLQTIHQKPFAMFTTGNSSDTATMTPGWK